MKISLRGQIFLWYSILMPLLILSLTLVAQQVLLDSTRAAVDERLQLRASIVANAIVSNPEIKPEEYEGLIASLTEKVLPYIPGLLRISDPQGNILATFGDVTEPMIPIMDRLLLLPETGEGRFETIKTRGQDSFRLFTVPVGAPATGKAIVLVQTGDILAIIGTAQEHLWQYTLLLGVAGIITTLLVGFVILRRGLNPLNKILARIQGIGSKNLNERIPIENRPPELQKMADTLNDLLYRLDAAFKTREIFIASVSHELRTPLTILQGEIEALLGDPATGREFRQNLEVMAIQVKRLVRMTNNLILNAQLESRPVLTPGTVNLNDLMAEIFREVRMLGRDLQLKVSPAEMVVIPGDYDLLKQMALNIVDNAIKFTPRGGAIEAALKYDGDMAVLEVSDTGPGIPQEIVASIGRPFQKSATPYRAERGGSGLGLAIVKQIVDLHRGQMEISSRKGRGTIVTLRLPVESSDPGV